MTEELNEVPRTTPDFATEAATKLAELFPEVAADGKINLDTLKTILDIDVEDGRERFGLTWPGKREAIRVAQTPTTATLMPDKENSVDWDTTQNVFIEGDNLEVLKILQKHYYGQIKMIYIDPPYNTGNDFVYADDYADSIGNYLELTGQTDDGGRLSTNSESSGRFHSNWLNMMYPRLKLARNLLTQDGAVLISVDDSEQANLRMMCDEIFGQNNFIATLVWQGGRKNDSRYVSVGHDYILVYARNEAFLKENGVRWRERKSGVEDALEAGSRCWQAAQGNPALATRKFREWLGSRKDLTPAVTRFKSIDQNGRVYNADKDLGWPGGGGPRFEVLHPITKRPVTTPSTGWRFTEESLKEQVQRDLIEFGVDEKKIPRGKTFLDELDSQVAESVFTQIRTTAAQRLRRLIGSGVFDYPKDEYVLARWTKLVLNGDTNGIVLDFFAGSGTTAHAVMHLNAEDGGNRRCISVQLPEPTGEKSEARKAGYETISQITRERIRRAGEKFLEEESGKLDGRKDLDVGFRAYKLVDTNFAKWKADSGLTEEDLVGLLARLADSANDHARPEALLTEVLLKLGFSLSEKIEKVNIEGLEVFSVAGGLVLAYLDEHQTPTLDQLRAMVAKEPERLVILEDAFQGNDELKTNLVQECKTRSVDLWTA
ncbi:site-specific DNA-methyltransferase [Trueperella abortisuis]|uniref:Adenine-specific DNA-methyltransferase n=1 Tax=Trueperella abortisuis TaxID=445930 RepID=A0ABT9PKD3_9ACTO|nr:site-specific DNA-methyltransferase [Trueperella abortisuis]MDP9832400.1 adenine-specific DNA-methyltransferase [Trueperella abortisuis]